MPKTKGKKRKTIKRLLKYVTEGYKLQLAVVLVSIIISALVGVIGTQFIKFLIDNNISISSVESFTVGNFAAMLGSIPGISKVYKGSLVTYQSVTKERLLGISHDIIQKYGVVSKEIASLMCINGKQILDSDICISFTGNAGPDAMEGKPVGLVYIGIYYHGINVYELNLKGSRQEIQKQAIDFVIRKLTKKIKVN